MNALGTWVPFVSKITTATGATFDFHYSSYNQTDGGHECVVTSIDRINLPSDGGAGVPVLAESYAYTSSGGSPRPGLLAEASSPHQTEVFLYDAGYMSMTVNQSLLFRHSSSAGLVNNDEGIDRNLLVTYASTSDGGADSCGNPYLARFVTNTVSGGGDGTGSGAPLVREYDIVTKTTLGFPRTYQITDKLFPSDQLLAGNAALDHQLLCGRRA